MDNTLSAAEIEDMMADDNDWRGSFNGLRQTVESYQSVLMGVVDTRNLSDSDRIRLVRDALAYAITMKARERETEELLNFVRKKWVAEDPTDEQLMDLVRRAWRMEEPSITEMHTFLRRMMRAEANKPKIMMEWLRLLVGGILGATLAVIGGYVLYRMTGKS